VPPATLPRTRLMPRRCLSRRPTPADSGGLQLSESLSETVVEVGGCLRCALRCVSLALLGLALQRRSPTSTTAATAAAPERGRDE